MARPSILSRIIQAVLSLIRHIHQFIQSLLERWTSATIALDSGRIVRIGQKLAEGGFSIVFQARDTQTNKLYALKRIQCPDKDQLRECLREAGVHRSLDHFNLMPLLGFGESGGLNQNDYCCYMLFPYCTHSLRDEISRRNLLLDRSLSDSARHKPWKEVTALSMFLNICRGVHAMHKANYTHRDVKVENILFQDFTSKQPLLMDFGSVGPVSQVIADRRQVMNIVENAAQHTTMPYRPPELFEGGVRAGDADIDYRKVDVWSLGCTLFAMLYGASPLEAEFATSGNAIGKLRVVECSQLKAIGPVPRPPSGSEVASWYSPSMQELVEYMLTQDRHQRPELAQVMGRVEQLIRELGGSVEPEAFSRRAKQYQDDGDDDGIALLSTNRLL